MHANGAGKRGRMVMVAGLSALAAMAGTATAASAATLTGTAADPVFTAAPGEVNNLDVTEDATTNQLRFTDSNGITVDPVATGCLVSSATVVACPEAVTGADIIDIDLGDMNDQTTFNGVHANEIDEDGGTGNDTLRSSAQAISVVMVGGPGGANDADTFIGSSAEDTVSYDARTAAVSATEDNVANDGEAGEGDSITTEIDSLQGGSGNDTLSGDATDNTIDGGAGNDTITGGGGQDFLSGGDGNDVIDGGAGDDFLSGGAGTDDLHGGTGIDTVFELSLGTGTGVTPLDGNVTLDDIGNDGAAGEGDNLHSDIENVTTSDGNDTIVGSAGPNILEGGGSNDNITGGPGNDTLIGDDGNDTINARDGFADRVDCGAGTDTAIVDTLDIVSADCESVDVANVGNAGDIPEDAPPTIAFASLKAGQRISPSSPTTVQINAADDHGLSRVVLLDDGVVVGSDTTAPFAISYQPKGSDVGRNTLVAEAIDGAGQTATAIVPITVGRFTPKSVSASVSPSRDRSGPFRFKTSGSVGRPTGVTAAQGCSGTVSVSVKRGRTAISTHHATLSKTCRYSSTASLASSTRHGKLTVSVKFLGNGVLATRSAKSRSIRVG